MSLVGMKTKNGIINASYDDTELRNMINGKVSSLPGYSLISQNDINKLQKLGDDKVTLAVAVSDINNNSINVRQISLSSNGSVSYSSSVVSKIVDYTLPS